MPSPKITLDKSQATTLKSLYRMMKLVVTNREAFHQGHASISAGDKPGIVEHALKKGVLKGDEFFDGMRSIGLNDGCFRRTGQLRDYPEAIEDYLFASEGSCDYAAARLGLPFEGDSTAEHAVHRIGAVLERAGVAFRK